jgi:hypothetical protein
MPPVMSPECIPGDGDFEAPRDKEATIWEETG